MSENNLEEGSNPNNQVFKDAENQIKEVCEVSQREATRIRQDQEAMDATSKKIDRVHLNIGGRHFTTSHQTLTSDPESMLAAMFSENFKEKPLEDGAFFIDRDGKHFRFILNYLRDGKLILPEGATFLKELEAEANFYQIKGLLRELKDKTQECFEESVILMNEEHRNTLKAWLPPQDGKWKLLFRASRDGFTAHAFHTRCDNKGPTVTIVESENNIFGGFTENSWLSKYID